MGVGLAYLAVAALARFGPADLPRLQMIEVNGQVLLFTVAATLFSALLFGLAPAIRLARAGVGETLKEGLRSIAGSPHQRMRRVLAGAQVALAFVLVVSSGLLLRSFVAMIATNPGFEPGGALTASVDLPTARYDATAATDFFRRASERLRALPGVREVAFSSDLPLDERLRREHERLLPSSAGRRAVGAQNGGAHDAGRRADGARPASSPMTEGPQARYHFITSGYTGARLAATAMLTLALSIGSNRHTAAAGRRPHALGHEPPPRAVVRGGADPAAFPDGADGLP